MPVMLRPGNENDIQVCKYEIEHEDVFHLKALYKRIYDYMVEEGWLAADSDGKDANYETLYWERKSQSEATEHHIWWRAFRVPEKNSYYRYFLKLDFQTLNVRKIEVMHKGHKYSTNKADVIIRVEAYLQLDYDNKWTKSGFMKGVHSHFKKRIYHEDIELYKTDLYTATYRINTLIKQYLQLKNPWADWGRSFHPERGI
jgi:hypothetical protein